MAPGPLGHRALAVLLTGLVLATAFALVAPRARAGTAVVFAEDFESGTLGPAWTASDGNPASGLDYWGISRSRTHTGNYSAWCAQVGTQASGGQNNSAVQQYDDNMQADLTVNLSVSGFASLTLSFYYWSKAEAGGGDYLEAWYVAGGVPTLIFQNRGTSNWNLVSLAVPNNVEQLVVRFTSDAANHGFEGAYVDDIVVTGTENNAPSSDLSPLPTYENSRVFDIPYTATDGANESGVNYVELWYRNATTGNFTLYTRPANPLGRWFLSPIRFDATYASGEGYYEFYSIAVDNAQNAEAPPAGPDASTTVDATPPVLAITSPTGGGWLTTSTVTVTWSASDAVSGLDRLETSLDGGATIPVGTSTSHAFAALSDQTHTVEVRAYDLAGNVAVATVILNVDTTPPALQITAPTEAQSFGTSAVVVTWDSTDATSGIDHYEVWLDGAAHQTTSDPRVTFTNVPDGQHTVHVLAVDRAGNVRAGAVTFYVNTFPWWLVILAVLAFLLILFFIWRRRKSEEAPPPAPKADAHPSDEADREGATQPKPEDPPPAPDTDLEL